MSQENVESERRLYALRLGSDLLSAAEELVHPDAVIDMSQNIFNPNVYFGFDGLRRFIAQVNEMWEDFRVEFDELIDMGDNVVAAHRISGKGRESGVEVEMPVFAIWTLRDGKVVRMTGGYRDRAQALRDAGQAE